MKKLLLIAALFVTADLPAFGQIEVESKPAAKSTDVKATVEPKPAPFVREKFNPLRDPKADLAAAIAIATNENKRIILDVGGEWCGWCVYMDKFFYDNPKLDKLRNDHYVWLKINMSPDNENQIFLAPYPVPTGYPHLFVLDETGKLLSSQDTAPLESGKGYDLVKFTAFLKAWIPESAAKK